MQYKYLNRQEQVKIKKIKIGRPCFYLSLLSLSLYSYWCKIFFKWIQCCYFVYFNNAQAIIKWLAFFFFSFWGNSFLFKWPKFMFYFYTLNSLFPFYFFCLSVKINIPRASIEHVNGFALNVFPLPPPGVVFAEVTKSGSSISKHISSSYSVKAINSDVIIDDTIKRLQ